MSKNQFITNVREKADIFNNFFANLCTVISNSSVLPPFSAPYTLDHFSTFAFDMEKVPKLINSLDSNKAHGCDEISIRMLKMCNKAISKLLTLLYKICLNEGVFPNIWKHANVVPVHKKADKSNFTNYCPMSLLPICGKILERLIYDTLLDFLKKRSLISSNQSGFIQGDSCINQLLPIVHMIHAAFDSNPSLEVRGLFLDISKAFDRVWHDGLLYKIKKNSICGSTFKLIKSFL